MILALYIPKPEELTISVLQLGIAYFVLCGMAGWMRLSVPLAAGLMALGCAMAIGPDIYAASQSNLGYYGETVREWNHTNDSDAFLAITSYLHVGRGKPLAFAGMAVAILLYAIIAKYLGRDQGSPDRPQTNLQGVTPHEEWAGRAE